jgi:DNA-directed RNA polymerase alpha subunit
VDLIKILKILIKFLNKGNNMSYDMKEFEKNRDKEHENGTYMDDGAVEVTCLYCGNKRPVLDTGECCERRRKEIKAIWDTSLTAAFFSGMYDEEIAEAKTNKSDNEL